MKNLKDCIYESVNFINEASTPEDKQIKKWLKSTGAKKFKVVNGEVVIPGKTRVMEHEMNLDADITELPDFIKFANPSYSAQLYLTADGLTTLKGFPYPSIDGGLDLHSKNLKDFDMDFSEEKSCAGEINVRDCPNLESLSGFKTVNFKYPPSLYIYSAPKLQSLKDLADFPQMVCVLRDVGIKNLEGYPLGRPWSFNGANWVNLKLEKCHNLVSFDGLNTEYFIRVIDIVDCPKLSKIGNMSLPKGAKTDFISFRNCPKVDEQFIEELVSKTELQNDGFYYFKLTNTGVKEDAPIIKKIKEKYPNLIVEVK